MKQHRFFGTFDFSKSHLTVHDPLLVHQMRRVLRMEVGNTCVLCTADGSCATGTLQAFHDTGIEFSLAHITLPEHGAVHQTTLYCAVLKKENFEWVVQKATEVGVARIVPLLTARTIKQSLKHDRLVSIAREAAEQSQRAHIPDIDEPRAIHDVLMIAPEAEKIVCDPSGMPLEKLSRTASETTGVYIGPEGGWDPKELSAFHEHQYGILSLGEQILRAETAAVVGSYEVITHHI